MDRFRFMFYAEGSRCYAAEFIETLSGKEQGKIKYYLELLEIRGPALKAPYSKKISREIYELRPGFGNTEIRLFYFWDGNTAWFVNGIIKKKQKTPRSAVETSEVRMKKYYEAKSSGGRN